MPDPPAPDAVRDVVPDAEVVIAPGDEVIGYIRGDVQRAHRGVSELVSTDVRILVRKPRAMSFAEAAGLLLAGLTAYQAVVHALDVQPGETLLVHGSAGGGGFARRPDRTISRVRVISTASAHDHGYVQTLGAEPVT